MSRTRPVKQAALVLALAVAAGCGGSGDPVSPPQPSATDAYLRATITLLDTGDPCRPGISCAPEAVSCDGLTPFTVPMEWTVRSSTATAGRIAYTPQSGGQPARGALAISGTDVARNTSLALEMSFVVDPATNAVTATVLNDPNATFANVETSCTRLNQGLDPFTLFGVVLAEPSSITIDSAPTSGGEFAFATLSGATLTGGVLSGSFDFIAQNREEVGLSVYQGRVRVQGCFRLPVPSAEQGVPVLVSPPSPACN